MNITLPVNVICQLYVILTAPVYIMHTLHDLSISGPFRTRATDR
jgi:hypothetical protein